MKLNRIHAKIGLVPIRFMLSIYTPISKSTVTSFVVISFPYKVNGVTYLLCCSLAITENRTDWVS